MYLTRVQHSTVQQLKSRYLIRVKTLQNQCLIQVQHSMAQQLKSLYLIHDKMWVKMYLIQAPHCLILQSQQPHNLTIPTLDYRQLNCKNLAEQILLILIFVPDLAYHNCLDPHSMQHQDLGLAILPQIFPS